MHRISRSLIVMLVAGLTACSLHPPKTIGQRRDAVPLHSITISEKFVVSEVTLATLPGEIRRCIPTENPQAELPTALKQEFPATPGVYAFTHWGSASQYLLGGAEGFCLRMSTMGFPVYASEALRNTVDPMGVPAEVAEDWRRQIAEKIAAQGRVDVLYPLSDKAAILASWWVEGPLLHQIHYQSRNLLGDAVLREHYDLRFAHPALASVMTTKRTSRKATAMPDVSTKSNLIMHRTEKLPELPAALRAKLQPAAPQP